MTQGDQRVLAKAALLHDIGKLVYRANQLSGTHSQRGAEFLKPFLGDTDSGRELLRCVRYHHGRELDKAKLEKDDLAYIVYEADNIASGVDRRTLEEGGEGTFDKEMPLYSVFSAFGGSAQAPFGKYHLRGLNEEDRFNYPLQESIKASSDTYARLVQILKENFQRKPLPLMSCNEVLRIYEDVTSFVPSSTNTGELADISLYMHSKVTAAVATCMAAYFADQGRADYKSACFDKNKEFRQEEAFLLVSGDLSGIQDFIYTIPTKGALKSLRGRSFYLEILMENIIDGLLQDAGLSRINLLYSGGGHFYALLPNTEAARASVAKQQQAVNAWLLSHVGTRIYLAAGMAPCTAAELLQSDSQGSVFARASQSVGKDKIQRYDAEMLSALFDERSGINAVHDATRECAICHTSTADLEPYGDSDMDQEACPMCAGLYRLGHMLVSYVDTCFVIAKKTHYKEPSGMPIYNWGDKASVYVVPVKELTAFAKDHDILRLYGKNKAVTGELVNQRLWVADYVCRDEQRQVMDFSQLADLSADAEGKGIHRLAVLRADVDNLGAAFISGFISDEEKNRSHYATLSRYSDLSRALSLFFKTAVNKLAKGELRGQGTYLQQPFSIWQEKEAQPRAAHIIYSGGDDVFIVGAWNDILELAVDMREAFRVYTQGKLTFSAGIAFFSPSYPIHSMAKITGELEDMAKKTPHKDAVALFGMDTNEDGTELLCHHVHKWDAFEQGVCREKLQFLQQSFNLQGTHSDALPVGKTMLYRLKGLVEELDRSGDKINLARFLYTLARMQPQKQKDEAKYERQMEIYGDVLEQLYYWVKADKDRKELLTALHLAIYYMRDNQKN